MAIDEHILGLEIAMQDQPLVAKGETREDLHRRVRVRVRARVRVRVKARARLRGER